MKALILTQDGFKLEDSEIQKQAGNIEINLHFAALNHRDLWIYKGQYAGIKYPIVLGSDGSGICQGEEVLLNPSVNWIDEPKHQPKNYEIIGLPNDGTLRQIAYYPKELIHPKPSHLSLKEAACLPLAGLTAFRVLFSRCNLKPTDKILVTGAGGGVASFVIQFALALACEVWVTSGKEEKLTKAINLGVKGGVNYKNEGWDKELKEIAGDFDVIIDGTGGSQFGILAGLAKPGGRIGIYGGTLGKIQNLSPQTIFWKQLSIYGSTMGNHDEFKDMLSFVSKHKIHPVIDTTFPLEEYERAFKKMEEGSQFGKILIDLQ